MSHEQNTTDMDLKNLLAIALLMPFAANAQTDSTRTDTTHKRTYVALGVSKDGAHTYAGDGDSDGIDTFRLELKHRIIRIISTRRGTDSTGADTLEDRLRKARRERRNLFTYWAGIEFGFNSFIAPDGRIGDGPQAAPFLLNNLRGRWVAINIMEQKYEFGSHHAGLFWGLGLEATNYHLSENVRLAYNSDSTWAVPVDDPRYTKNKLRQLGVRLPIMFEFNTKKAPLPSTPDEWVKFHEKKGFSRKGNFHFALGVVGSWYFDHMYKQKYRADGDLHQERDKGDYNLLPYRVAARAQIGVGGLNLFAEYGLTPLFKEGSGPALTPLTVGLTLIGFN